MVLYYDAKDLEDLKEIQKDVNKIYGFKIKYNDVWDFKEFYVNLHDYLKDKGWKDHGRDSDDYEYYWFEQDDGNRKEYYVKWKMYKNIPGSKLFKYYLDWSAHLVPLNKHEFILDGKKMKADKGEIEMNMYFYLHEDPEGIFQRNWFMKKIHDFFFKRFWKKEKLMKIVGLLKESGEIQQTIKKWFKIYAHFSDENTELFYPSKAYPSTSKKVEK